MYGEDMGSLCKIYLLENCLNSIFVSHSQVFFVFCMIIKAFSFGHIKCTICPICTICSFYYQKNMFVHFVQSFATIAVLIFVWKYWKCFSIQWYSLYKVYCVMDYICFTSGYVPRESSLIIGKSGRCFSHYI